MTESKVGLANPYALAEIALGRKINWKSIADHEGFVKKTLGASIDELCAPAPGNLMVSGAADSQDILTEIHSKKGHRAEEVVRRAKAGPVSTMLTKLSQPAQARVSGALVGGKTAHQATLRREPCGRIQATFSKKGLSTSIPLREGLVTAISSPRYAPWPGRDLM